MVEPAMDRDNGPIGVMPKPLSLRCNGAGHYSSQWRITASGLPPRHAVRREKPSLRHTTPPRDTGAKPRRPEPKPKRRRSNYRIRACKRNPAQARAEEPPREAPAAGPRRPQPCRVEVPERFLAAEFGQEQAPGRVRDKCLPPEAGAHKWVVRGPHSRPRPIRPGRPTFQMNRISFSYTLLILKLRESSTLKIGLPCPTKSD
jgi:hypothetical protein